jgi:hypothetical protein
LNPRLCSKNPALKEEKRRKKGGIRGEERD